MFVSKKQVHTTGIVVHVLGAECAHEGFTLSSSLQGVAKRVPVSEFPEQPLGHQGVKAITLAVGDALAAMHVCIYPGELWMSMAPCHC